MKGDLNRRVLSLDTSIGKNTKITERRGNSAYRIRPRDLFFFFCFSPLKRSLPPIYRFAFGPDEMTAGGTYLFQMVNK